MARIVLQELELEGTILEAIQQSGDVEATVRRALEVGASVLAHAASRERNGTALTGDDYQRAVGLELGRRFKESVQDTTEERGVLDDRAVGDFVVRGRHGSRVVVEAKNKPLTMPQCMKELDDAMANREAQAGVLVFAGAHQCGGVRFRVCRKDRILAVWDPIEGDDVALDAALQLAQCLAASAKQRALDHAYLSTRMRRIDHVLCRPSLPRADARQVVADIQKRFSG